MDPGTTLLLAFLVVAIAMLFASVGHAGASGYLAAMALVGISPELMKPTALSLNILVASIASVKFYRAGSFSWPVLWPLILLSVPCAFIGGALSLPGVWYQRIVGGVLLYAAIRLILVSARDQGGPVTPMALPVGLTTGGGIGLLSGLTGVGGGIFLSPLLLLNRWTDTRTASGVVAAFILVNSVAGLLGHATQEVAVSTDHLLILAPAAVAGGWIGAELGSRRLKVTAIRRLLVAILLIAALKMMVA